MKASQFTFEKIFHVTSSLVDKIAEMIPDDDIKEKRICNLRKSVYVLVAKKEQAIVGVFYMRKIFGIPNATWIVKENYRRQGIASRLLQAAQKERFFITARCRTTISLKLARKSGFVILPLGLSFWMKIQ